MFIGLFFVFWWVLPPLKVFDTFLTSCEHSRALGGRRVANPTLDCIFPWYSFSRKLSGPNYQSGYEKVRKISIPPKPGDDLSCPARSQAPCRFRYLAHLWRKTSKINLKKLRSQINYIFLSNSIIIWKRLNYETRSVRLKCVTFLIWTAPSCWAISICSGDNKSSIFRQKIIIANIIINASTQSEADISVMSFEQASVSTVFCIIKTWIYITVTFPVT